MTENGDWVFFNGVPQVENAVAAALQQVGKSHLFFLARLGRPTGAGAGDPRCVELWAAQISGVAPEIRHCRGMSEQFPDMVEKFAQTFRTLWSDAAPRADT